jgi:hypothetical protein
MTQRESVITQYRDNETYNERAQTFAVRIIGMVSGGSRSTTLFYQPVVLLKEEAGVVVSDAYEFD